MTRIFLATTAWRDWMIDGYRWTDGDWPVTHDTKRSTNPTATLAAPRFHEPLRLRILLSYWYYRTTDLDALFAKYFTPPYPEVFADSGAFSAMTQGAKISLDEYAEWLLRWKHLFSVYANLDVIRNAGQTWKNQKTLEDAYGLGPLPVFHVAESWEWLDKYLAEYQYIALGVAGTPASRYMPWLVQCFQRGNGRAVYHGFGITSWDPLRLLPWYSVDSSSWGQGFRFGVVPLFDEQRGLFHKLELGNYKGVYKHARLIRELGFNPEDFADRNRNDRAKVCALAALSYMLAERYLRGVHGPIYIPRKPSDGDDGLKVHLAVSDSGTPATLDSKGYGGINNLGPSLDGKSVHHAGPDGLKIHLAVSEKDKPIHHDQVGGNSGVGSMAGGMAYLQEEAGLKLHLVVAEGGQPISAEAKGGNMGVGAVSSALAHLHDQPGIRIHLADTSNGINYGDADRGLKLYLAESTHDIQDIRRAASHMGLGNAEGV